SSAAPAAANPDPRALPGTAAGPSSSRPWLLARTPAQAIDDREVVHLLRLHRSAQLLLDLKAGKFEVGCGLTRLAAIRPASLHLVEELSGVIGRQIELLLQNRQHLRL